MYSLMGLLIFVSHCFYFQLNVFSERTWKARVRAELANYQKEIVSAIKNGYEGADTTGESKQWSFAGAFLYSLTVITTIGKFIFYIFHFSYTASN